MLEIVLFIATIFLLLGALNGIASVWNSALEQRQGKGRGFQHGKNRQISQNAGDVWRPLYGPDPAAPADPPAPANTANQEQPGPAPVLDCIKGHRKLATLLSEKSEGLPEDMRVHVEGIIRSTGAILRCMEEDPQDLAPGDRFLSRYLKAAQGVADKYSRFAAQGGMHEEFAPTLKKGREILARLEQAFLREHAALLRNDNADFAAELNVLDTLLKMDGR